MSNNTENPNDNNNDGSYFKPGPAVDILSVVKSTSKGKDGDWDQVFGLLQNNDVVAQVFCVESASAKDSDGRTILHHACLRRNENDAVESVKMLFEKANGMEITNFVNEEDKEGNTALQCAARREYKILMKLLLKNGAVPYLLKKDTHKIYDQVLISIFDDSLKIKHDDEPTCKHAWQIDSDFGPITGRYNHETTFNSHDLKETSHLAWILGRKTTQKANILQHPLVRIFLYLKHSKYKYMLWYSMIHNVIWSLLSGLFIFCNTNPILDNANSTVADWSSFRQICSDFRVFETCTNKVRFTWPVIINFCFFSLASLSEIAEMIQRRAKSNHVKYQKSKGHLGILLILLMIWALTFVGGLWKAIIISSDWVDGTRLLSFNDFVKNLILTPLCTVGIFVCFLLTQVQLSKLEFFGIYNEMFIKGLANICKFLFAFLPLLLAFLITFHLQLPMNADFTMDNGLGLSKILAMMTGELNMSDVIGTQNHDAVGEHNMSDVIGTQNDDAVGDEGKTVSNILKIIFLVFIVTVVILLQNLLIGVTVSDVQKLEAKAKVNYLAVLLQQISTIEFKSTHPWLLKLVLSFKLEHLYRKKLLVAQVDVQKKVKGKEGERKIIPETSKNNNNNKLEDYPEEIQQSILKWYESRVQIGPGSTCPTCGKAG